MSRRLFITVLRPFSTSCPALNGVMATTQQRSVQRPLPMYSPSARRKRPGVASCTSDSSGEAAPGARQTVHDVLDPLRVHGHEVARNADKTVGVAVALTGVARWTALGDGLRARRSSGRRRSCRCLAEMEGV
ncbi:hypothetical protein BT67DRAFT_10224 [Trichocladium antarcticum]|uniref:Uncharacterized protein n=1 Tax=Trichocladium antarcticum TaxID=1450529 RepID=A0AAN6ZHV2_9PEZI|nr:hypothetical protein BT67DRAFT_10224 [Trichocladium antarcticum]